MNVERRRRLLVQKLQAKSSFQSKIQNIESSSLVAHFPCIETSGTVMRDFSSAATNGTYSNVTLNATTYRGQPIPSFNGSSSVASFTSTILGTKGTLILIGRVSALADWSDSTARFMMRIQVDANNLLFVQKTTGANQLQIRYRAGSTEKSLNISTSAVDFFKLVVTWGDLNNGNAVNAWFNGIAQTQQTVFGAFAGVIGTKNFGENSANSWKGNLGRISIWNTILSAADINLLNAA